MPSVRPAPVDDTVSCWINHMRRGEFAAAWAINDGVRQTKGNGRDPAAPRHQQQIWDGTPVEGRRVLVRCYHGLGDTIQFIRYAEPLRARARDVVVWAQPRLMSLLETVRGVDRLIPLHDGEIETGYDVDLEIMELPYLFRTTGESIPARIPYIQAEPEPLRTRGLAVGLVWRSGDWAPHRSIPFTLLAPLVTMP